MNSPTQVHRRALNTNSVFDSHSIPEGTLFSFQKPVGTGTSQRVASVVCPRGKNKKGGTKLERDVRRRAEWRFVFSFAMGTGTT